MVFEEFFVKKPRPHNLENVIVCQLLTFDSQARAWLLNIMQAEYYLNQLLRHRIENIWNMIWHSVFCEYLSPPAILAQYLMSCSDLHISWIFEYFGFLPNIRCHVLWCTYCTCDIWISGVKLCTAHILNGITPRSTLEVGATRPMDKLSCLLWNLAFVCLCFPIILPSSLLLVLCYFLNGKYLLNQARLTWSSRAVDARSLVLLPLMLPSQ